MLPYYTRNVIFIILFSYIVSIPYCCRFQKRSASHFGINVVRNSTLYCSVIKLNSIREYNYAFDIKCNNLIVSELTFSFWCNCRLICSGTQCIQHAISYTTDYDSTSCSNDKIGWSVEIIYYCLEREIADEWLKLWLKICCNV